MRIKNDTIIKWSNLAATMYLSNEEFGALIRNVMIEDDIKGIRHDYIPEDALKFLKEKEEEWQKDFSELSSKNPQLIQAFITVFGQASHSHRAFDKLQEKYDTEDIENAKEENKKPKAEKPKAEKPKAEKPKVSKQFNSDYFDLTLNVSENFEIKDSDIKTATDYLEEIGKYEEMKSIIVSAIQEADKDNYKYDFMTYVMTQIENEVMNNSKSKVSDEKDEFPF